LATLFELTDTDVLRDIVRASPLAAVVTAGPEGLDVRHFPMLLRGDTLVGHVARGNPLARRDGAQALAIFRAADAYVTTAAAMAAWMPGDDAAT
jgi:transcriptional regulator